MKLTQEIFAVGTWNGFPFTLNDLRKMAQAFKDLGQYLKVPLKIGHNDEQAITDGQPAIGWVTDMTVDEQSKPPKLIATFDDVPGIVSEAIAKKLYRNVSIELDFDVAHKDARYDFVVTAVALLGADLPAVNVLNDLGAFLASRDSNLPQGDYSVGRHVTFSAIKQPIGGAMTLEEMQAALAKKEAELAAANAKFSTLETTSKAQFEALQANFDKLQADTKAAAVTAARAKFTAILDDAVRSGSIIPAQREVFKTVLGLDDDEKVVELNEADVKALFGNAGTPPDGKTAGSDDDDGETADVKLVSLTRKFMLDHGERSFTKAFFSVAGANPELHAEYLAQNGEVRL